MIVVGVDPGARYTGIVVVNASTRVLIGHSTVQRDASRPQLPLDGEYLFNVIDTFRAMSAAYPRALVGVEVITDPTRHMGRAAYNVEPLLATALLAGVIVGLSADGAVVQLAPAGFGGAALGQYPEGLVSPAEARKPGWRTRVGGGGAKLRHERSAYDVAIRAAQLWKGTRQ